MRTLIDPLSAVDSPVVVAMVVDVALAVKEESVSALFDTQGAILAEEEVVAQLGMRVRLFAVRLRAARLNMLP